MIGATISDAYLAPLLAVSFTSVIGLMAWIVKTLLEISRTLSDHGARLKDLERDQAYREADERERHRYR